MAMHLVLSYHCDTLVTCSQDLHAHNIMFFFFGLAGLAVQVWRDTPILVPLFPVILGPMRLRPKYLVEAGNITNAVQSDMSKHGKEGIYAVTVKFKSNPFT